MRVQRRYNRKRREKERRQVRKSWKVLWRKSMPRSKVLYSGMVL